MDDVVMYAAVLDMRGRTVGYLADLLAVRREQVGRRDGTRALTCFQQAVFVVRWFLDGARVASLVADNGIGVSTGYRYLHEGIDALAAQAPDLRTALESAKCDKAAFLSLDGVVFPTDRVAAPGPDGADLWWSGKHEHHGGNIQVLTRPDGRPGSRRYVRAANTT